VAPTPMPMVVAVPPLTLPPPPVPPTIPPPPFMALAGFPVQPMAYPYYPTAMPPMAPMMGFVPAGTAYPAPIPQSRGHLHSPGPATEAVPYTGPPDPDTLTYQDPHIANTGPPLHDPTSTAPEARTAYIANVPNNITETQIQDFFSIVGTVTRVKLCGEETLPSRFAFVEFATVAECHQAIAITGVVCCGRPLKISQSKGGIVGFAGWSGTAPNGSTRTPEEQDKIERTVYVSNLPTIVPEVEIVEFIGLSGKVINYKFCGDLAQETRYAFFEFDNRASAAACKAISGTEFAGYVLKCADSKGIIHSPAEQALAIRLQNAQSLAVVPSTPGAEAQSRTVYVGNIDPAITETDLKAWFEERVGPVTKTNMLEGTTGGYRYGFVEFGERSAAMHALQFNGTKLATACIKVAPSRGTIPKAATTQLPPPPDKAAIPAALAVLNNQAYALALQEENRKYQEFLLKKMRSEEGGGSRRRKHRSRSRSASPKKRRSSRSRSRGRKDSGKPRTRGGKG
jgi:RNA recognition motif-containing protein